MFVNCVMYVCTRTVPCIHFFLNKQPQEQKKNSFAQNQNEDKQSKKNYIDQQKWKSKQF